MMSEIIDCRPKLSLIGRHVKERAMCESESIYGTLYGTLGEEDAMEEE